MAADDLAPPQLMRWIRAGSDAARAMWDRHGEAALMNRIAQRGRDLGALRRTGVALQAAASAAMAGGEFGAAAPLISEAIEVTDAAGRRQWSDSLIDLELAACQGRESDARAAAEAGRTVARATGLARVIDQVDSAIVTLDLGLGRYDEALDLSRAIVEHDSVPFGNTILPDFVEAAVRGGDAVAARRGVERLRARATASGTPLALGLLARFARARRRRSGAVLRRGDRPAGVDQGDLRSRPQPVALR